MTSTLSQLRSMARSWTFPLTSQHWIEESATWDSPFELLGDVLLDISQHMR